MLARRDQRSSTEDTLNEPLQFTYVAVLFTLDLHQQFTVGSLAEQTCTAPILLHQYYYTNTSTALLRPSLLTIIMSSERPSETNLIPQATGSFKGNYLLFFICHERPLVLCRRSKWIQVLINLPVQGE